MTEMAARIDITLETVTPLFLGGAEPRGKPELRSPSFRGALRYWLRAALGGVLGDDEKAVRCAEASVFGSTEEEWGGASAVIIQVSHPTLTPQEFRKQPAQTIIKYGRQLKQPTGRDYLYWPMAQFRNLPARYFIPPNTSFTLTLRVRPGVPDWESKLYQAMGALWLLVQLGGVGSRSRRTAGSLVVSEPEQFSNLSFALKGSTPRDIAAELGEGLKRIRTTLERVYKAEPPKFQGPHAAFDVLHPQVCKIWVLGLWASWEKAVESIGAAFRDFRTYREPDHTEVERWLNGESISTVERAVFGLPLPFRYQNGPSGTVQGRTQPAGEEITRRASPLWLKVSKTKGEQFAGIATLFLSAFLPEKAELYAQGGQGPALPPPKDYSLILKFVGEKFPKAVEVKYD